MSLDLEIRQPPSDWHSPEWLAFMDRVTHAHCRSCGKTMPMHITHECGCGPLSEIDFLVCPELDRLDAAERQHNKGKPS